MITKPRILQVLFLYSFVLCLIVSSALASDYPISSDSGLPTGTDVLTWSKTGTAPIFNGTYEGLVPPEGIQCFRTSNTDWVGWGIFFVDGSNNPTTHDLSGYSAYNLTFWVKSNTDLKIEMKDSIGVSAAKRISAYGWNNTVTWQKISIPIGAFARNLAQIISPFMVTMDRTPYGEFYIDDARLEEAGNHDPVIDSVAVRRITVQQPYSYTVHAIDYDGDAVTYSLLQKPAGMTINAQTGLIQWNTLSSDIGVWSIIIKAQDSRGGFTLQDYSLYVVSSNATLYQTALPYVKYYIDGALNSSTGFGGFARSFQIDLGGNSAADLELINFGAASYDQAILGRITLDNNQTTILDTYIQQHRTVLNNPLMKLDAGYNDASGEAIHNGPYRIVRILNRTAPVWANTWDWTVDTGATGCLILYAAEAYQKTQGADYINLAILWGEYLLRLQDTDGGLRYGPIGMYHVSGNNFYWKLKSTEQNERALYAFDALYQITGRQVYAQVASGIKNWLKQMYNSTEHLFYSSATFDGAQWVKSPLGTDADYVATDVMAFAPVEMMFDDSYFGSTQALRDAEVDAMFAAIEQRTAFLDGQGQPQFYRFSVSQDSGTYGSVEISSQMALAYLRVSKIYQTRGIQPKAQEYLNKYNSLILSMESYFTAPASDASARVAPYASYFATGAVAGRVLPYGPGGVTTYNCRAALASAYFAFAKAGYEPLKITPRANTNNILNLTEVPWYGVNNTYSSTGAAAAEMIINYIRQGAGQSLITDQNAIYQYAFSRNPSTMGSDLLPEEISKALGHYDPYDALVTGWADSFDGYPGGNPFQGYNFSVDVYNTSDPDAASKYLRDICHWMAFLVTQANWWVEGPLVARPNTPAAVPLFGSFGRWAVVKGYAVSANPNPNPRTDPFNTPNFTVYGFWVKDPVALGIGKDTYKTANECLANYFLPIDTNPAYNGKYVQVAEPPLYKSQAKIDFVKPDRDLANLEFIGADTPSLALMSTASRAKSSLKSERKIKQSWKDIVDERVVSDPQASAAFKGTKMGKRILVKRPDSKTAGYYLVPFGKHNRRGTFLVSAVVILDSQNGFFKEASWTDAPQEFLKVDKMRALSILRKHLQLKRILSGARLLQYLMRAQLELVWQPQGYSLSPYQPYWKITVNNDIWYVTQEAKVTSGGHIKPLAAVK